ncbi:MAG: hypothetical protein CHACPFDD_01363 [Phycisphaerae bacterium]|nr:hypothetical protein [Phycisphaerae bacterium]
MPAASLHPSARPRCAGGRPARDNRRRAGVVVMVAVLMVALLGMAALSVDVGTLYVARTELQRVADSAAMAAASKLLDEDRLKGSSNMAEEMSAARTEAVHFALANWVLNGHPELDPNTSNSASGDVVIGYIYDPSNLGESLNLGDPSLYNSVRVLVRRNSIRNGSILHKFATIFGNSSADLGATATATFKDGVVGYKVTDKTGNADLLPLALQKDYWAGLLDWSLSTGDNYAYDPATGAVTAGHDGIPELNLFPGAGSGQLPPGNFGTVDIGSPNNSAADLSRQIRYGISADDLAYFGGELNLGSDGVLPLNGDTGLTASIKDDLISILGQPRAIPIFSTVSGPGNNSVFNVVGFVGIRIMNVRLTGAMKSKEVVIQPAYVVDDAVITAAGAGSSYFVYEPVHLTR